MTLFAIFGLVAIESSKASADTRSCNRTVFMTRNAFSQLPTPLEEWLPSTTHLLCCTQLPWATWLPISPTFIRLGILPRSHENSFLHKTEFRVIQGAGGVCFLLILMVENYWASSATDRWETERNSVPYTISPPCKLQVRFPDMEVAPW